MTDGSQTKAYNLAVIEFEEDIVAMYHKQFRKALRAGFASGWTNVYKCPYPDIAKPSGSTSWSRAFRNAWKCGWGYGERARRRCATQEKE